MIYLFTSITIQQTYTHTRTRARAHTQTEVRVTLTLGDLQITNQVQNIQINHSLDYH